MCLLNMEVHLKTLFLSALLVLVSCGKKDNSKSSRAEATKPVVTEQPTPTASLEEGSFDLVIKPLNSKYSQLKGTGSLEVTESLMNISMNVSKASPLRSIFQKLYQGECPDLTDDKNGDGLIDIGEAEARLGKAILGFDSTLESSAGSNSVFPRTNLLGKYSYKASAKKDLILADILKNHGALKIDPQHTVVLFQGLPQFVRFPNSVESANGAPVAETLPVGCAKIEIKTQIQ